MSGYNDFRKPPRHCPQPTRPTTPSTCQDFERRSADGRSGLDSTRVTRPTIFAHSRQLLRTTTMLPVLLIHAILHRHG